MESLKISKTTIKRKSNTYSYYYVRIPAEIAKKFDVQKGGVVKVMFNGK